MFICPWTLVDRNFARSALPTAPITAEPAARGSQLTALHNALVTWRATRADSTIRVQFTHARPSAQC